LNEFHRDLLFLLHDVARLLRVEADKRARVNGMTRAQWAILIWLERQPGISQKELSEILEVEPINAAPIRVTAGSGGCTCCPRPTTSCMKSTSSAPT
jgi:hypothetical protein